MRVEGLTSLKIKKTHPHAFRDAPNTRRQEMGLEVSLRKILLNQSIQKMVNSMNYLKKYREI